MANGISGQQPTGKSGRQAAQPAAVPQAEPASPARGASGRAPAIPGSGRQSAQPAANPGSRPVIPAAQVVKPASKPVIPAANRSTRRMPAEANPNPAPGGGVAKKQRGGPELLYAFGGIAVFFVLLLVYGIYKKGAVDKAKADEKSKVEIYERNLKLAKDLYIKAELAGKLFVMGQEPAADDALAAKLFGPFKGDDKIYNVIYDRTWKDKRTNTHTDQKALHPELTKIDRMEKGRQEDDIRLNYGYADNKAVAIVLANKTIKGPKDDMANLGGAITVIVKAEEDEYFKKGREAKAPATETKNVTTEEKK